MPVRKPREERHEPRPLPDGPVLVESLPAAGKGSRFRCLSLFIRMCIWVPVSKYATRDGQPERPVPPSHSSGLSRVIGQACVAGRTENLVLAGGITVRAFQF